MFMPLPITIAVALTTGSATWLLFFVRRTQRHQLHKLGQSGCPVCGTRYGSAAAERARQEYVAQFLEARRQRPGIKINFARYWEIRCAQCGAEARFHYETGLLVPHAA